MGTADRNSDVNAFTHTMYLDQSAHLDWDWIRTFEVYYQRAYDRIGVKAVLTQALTNLEECNSPTAAPYYYSICEMGFLQRFIDDDPTRATTIIAQRDNFQVLGGGITSPDCLVCSGEGFIRNYLVGHTWLAKALPSVSPRPYCIIPDDFGQDPELPTLLQAMGFPGVAFSRLPGTFMPYVFTEMKQLMSHGVDFTWRAADGSEAIGHWMICPSKSNYAYASAPGNGDLQPIARLVELYENPSWAYQNGTPVETGHPAADADPSPAYPGAATPFMYYPVENDFSLPIPDLLPQIDAWNAGEQEGSTTTGVYVKAGTFADFMQGVLDHRDELQVLAPYNGTPYWTGFYASRPELKLLHYETVRTLVAAEAFGMLAEGSVPDTFWTDVAAAWAEFVPSTHHDYVCGTACDHVYKKEQLPKLQKAASTAASLRDEALKAMAGVAGGGSIPIVVANALGLARTDLVELPAPSVTGAVGVQPSCEEGTLFRASVPSLGFAVVDLADNPPAAGPASITPEAQGEASYTLANEFLEATISEKSGWSIEHLMDRFTGKEVLTGAGNELVFYYDTGDIYRFGNERGDQEFYVEKTTVVTSPAEVLEGGPLRVRLRTTVTATAPQCDPVEFTREYSLVAGEPFVRMTTTGAAPDPYSVMTRFEFGGVVEIAHGTPGHWTAVQPLPGFWDPPVFRATHNFVLPLDKNGTTLAAVYHGATPAWAPTADGALIGCLLRNTPGTDNYGATGTDKDPHTQSYALRVPSRLGGPETGAPLCEALRFNSPPLAARATGTSSQERSLVSTSAPAIVTVAKPGSFDPTSLILRLYQPTNEVATVDVEVNEPPVSASVVTALEKDWPDPPIAPTPTPTGFSLEMPNAWATVSVEGRGLP